MLKLIDKSEIKSDFILNYYLSGDKFYIDDVNDYIIIKNDYLKNKKHKSSNQAYFVCFKQNKLHNENGATFKYNDRYYNLYYIFGLEYSSKDFADETSHKLCNFCKNFCKQECFI